MRGVNVVIIYIGLYFLQAFAIMLAVRKLRQHQKELDRHDAKLQELRVRNAQLLGQMVDHTTVTKDTQKYFRFLFNKTDGMVLVHGVSEGGGPGTFIEANDIACERLGYSREELMLMTPVDIESHDEVEGTIGHARIGDSEENVNYAARYAEMAVSHSARQRIADVLKQGSVTCNRALKTRAGRAMPVSLTETKLEMNGKPVIMCTAIDLEEKIQSERTLRETQERLEDLDLGPGHSLVTHRSHKRIAVVIAQFLVLTPLLAFEIAIKGLLGLGWKLGQDVFLVATQDQGLESGRKGQQRHFVFGFFRLRHLLKPWISAKKARIQESKNREQFS